MSGGYWWLIQLVPHGENRRGLRLFDYSVDLAERNIFFVDDYSARLTNFQTEKLDLHDLSSGVPGSLGGGGNTHGA